MVCYLFIIPLSYGIIIRHGAVAHRLEQAAHNHLVDGSIPSSPTIELTLSTSSEVFLFALATASRKLAGHASGFARSNFPD